MLVSRLTELVIVLAATAADANSSQLRRERYSCGRTGRSE